jgi:ABC-type multidrug transport system ATPase subunit
MSKYFSLDSFSFAFNQKAGLFFDNVSIDIIKPGITFILGKNGVGKSTFIRLLQGIVDKSEYVTGNVTLHDKRYNLELKHDRELLYSRSMILHQSFDTMLAQSFTGFENLTFVDFNKNPDLSFVSLQSNISEFVSRFNIPLDKPVGLLSGGQRQILAMLMVTKNPLDLLFLDEPTAALDDKNSDYVMKSILDLAIEKKLVLFCIVHDMAIVEKYATNVISITQDAVGKRHIKVL